MTRQLMKHHLPRPPGLSECDTVLDVGAGIRPMNWYAPAEHLCVEPYGPYADRLEAAGLVERRAAADDGRGYELVQTPAGRSMRRKMWPAYETQIRELFAAHLSLEEARVMGEVLARAVQAARNGKIPG